jgi:hypothetical protein
MFLDERSQLGPALEHIVVLAGICRTCRSEEFTETIALSRRWLLAGRRECARQCDDPLAMSAE